MSPPKKPTPHMTAVVFDTLSYAEKLENGGYTAQQAKTQAHAMKELIEDQIASKTDIAATEAALKLDITKSENALKLAIAESKADTIKWVIGVTSFQTALIAGLILHLAQ